MTAALYVVPAARAVNEAATATSVRTAVAPCSSEEPPACELAACKSERRKKRRPAVPEWELAELAAQAEAHNQRIVESELSVLDDYWVLGRLLDRVRGNFPRGAWQPWLKRRGIDGTRAKRARLLAEMFHCAEELRGLTLHEALKIARERKKAVRAPRETTLRRQFCSAMKKLLGIARDLAATEDDARQYSPLAEELAQSAARIRLACQAPPSHETAV